MRTRINQFYKDRPEAVGKILYGRDSHWTGTRGLGYLKSLNMSGNALAAWNRGERPKHEIRKMDCEQAIRHLSVCYPKAKDLKWTVASVKSNPDLEAYGTPHHVGANKRLVLFIDLYDYFQAELIMQDLDDE